MFDYINIFIFIMMAIGFVFFVLLLVNIITRLLKIAKKEPEKDLIYECGEKPLGPAWIRFNIRFYIIALIFIIFDVEILMLFPWAVKYKELIKDPELGGIVFFDMLIFAGILFLGLLYVWAKGDLNWIKPEERKKK